MYHHLYTITIIGSCYRFMILKFFVTYFCEKIVNLLPWQERHLGEMNKQLRNKVSFHQIQVIIIDPFFSSHYILLLSIFQLEAEGATFRAIQGSWASDAGVSSNAFSMQPSQSSGMDCEPTLQIGYYFSFLMLIPELGHHELLDWRGCQYL